MNRRLLVMMMKRRTGGVRLRSQDHHPGEAGASVTPTVHLITTRGMIMMIDICYFKNIFSFYWSNEPRLKEIKRMVKSHDDCRAHYNESLGVSSYIAKQRMTKLCIYQEREIDVGAEYKMISETEFQFIDKKQEFYTQKQTQPSVGDSGAPVFSFLGRFLTDLR